MENNTRLQLPPPPPLAYYEQQKEPPTPDQYPKERIKTLIAFGGAALAALANLFVLTVIHDYVGRKAIPDVVFALIPQQEWAWKAGDTLVGICVVTTVTCILLHKHRWIVARRWMLMTAVLYTLRLVSLSVTQLPASFENNHQSCRPAKNRTYMGTVLNRLVEQLFMLGLQGSEKGYLCGDLLFSGHTLVFTMCCFVLNRYTIRTWWPLRWFMTAACIAGMVFMVICRSHYTVDVIFAYWLSTGMFTLYHAFCDAPHTHRRKSSFRRLWVFWLFIKMEKNVPYGPLPNELNWPLPWPKVCSDTLKKWSDENGESCARQCLRRGNSEACLKTEQT